MSRNKKIILAATFLAMLIVLSRFLSIKTPIIKISFGFVPTMLCATYLGWRWTMLVNVLGDLIGALLFPIGPFFVGYTITTAIAGLIYGLLLYKKHPYTMADRQFLVRIIVAVILVAVVVNMGLNTLCMSLTLDKAFLPLFGARVIKQLIMIPIHVIVFFIIEKSLRKSAASYLYSGEPDDSN